MNKSCITRNYIQTFKHKVSCLRSGLVTVFMMLSVQAFSQVNVFNTFEDLVDTSTTIASPVGGYDSMLKHLEAAINKGDTIGKKFGVPLYAIRFIVTSSGKVDSAHIVIPHAAGPIHQAIIDVLVTTRWTAAKDHERPVKSYHNLDGKLAFNKRVLKKYRRPID